jgi:hypothetical protein
MKKALQVLLVILLLMSMLLVMASCITPIDNPDPKTNNGGNNNDDDNDDDDDDDTNPYAYIFAEILSRINGINSIEGYLDLLSYLYETLPADKLATAVETLAGEQYGDMIDEYYEKGAEILAMANIAAPFLPYLNKIYLIRNFIETGNSIMEELAKKALQEAGVTITKNTDTGETSYSYTDKGVVYNITVKQGVYTIAFSDTTISIGTFEDNENLYDITYTESDTTKNILFEYTDALYKVTESGIIYQVEYDEDEQNFSFVSGPDAEGEIAEIQYLFESVITADSNLAIQFYQAQSNWVMQLLTDISEYKATVSIQTMVTAEPETIIDGIGADFATKGVLFNIDESTLGALLPN